MTISTDGQICYGIPFDESCEFPWDDKRWDGIEDWWLYEVCGYTNPFELYINGGYIDGIRPPEEEIDQYHKTMIGFQVKHPCPITLVNYCSCDAPMYILAVPSSIIVANRGYPKHIDVTRLVVSNQEIDALFEFCREHNLYGLASPKWWLSSYWG